MSPSEPESASTPPSPASASTATHRIPSPVGEATFPSGVGICAVALSGAMVGLHTIFHVQYTFKGADWKHPGQYLPAVLLLSMLAFLWSIVSLLSPNAWLEHGVLQQRYRKASRFIWLGFTLMLIGVIYAVSISFEPIRTALESVLPEFEWLALPED